MRWLTLHDLIVLEEAGNPYVAQKNEATPGDQFQFLWWMSPDYHPKSIWKRRKFIKRIKGTVEEVNSEIIEYVNLMHDGFYPYPKSDTKNPTKLHTAWVSGIAHRMMKTYGAMSYRDVIETPLPIIAQLRQEMTADDFQIRGEVYSPKGAESDRLRNEMMKRINEIKEEDSVDG